MVKQRSLTWKDYVTSLTAGALVVGAVVLCVQNYNIHGIDWLMYLGWVVWAVGLLLCITPMRVLLKRGGVAQGHSWVKTTVVVDSGPYAIVRHPIYVGWMVMVFALMLMSQYWVVAVCGAAAMPLVYFDIWREDRDNVEKFGEDYVSYQKKVPMTNFVWGAAKLLLRGRSK